MRPRKVTELRPFGDVDAAFRLPVDATTWDLWDAWAFAAVESTLALQAWTSAEDDDKEQSYHAYIACLDREEQAAAAVAERVDPPAAARLRAA
jgi:hypothetical protein